MSQTKSAPSSDATPTGRRRPKKLDRDNSTRLRLESTGGSPLPSVNRQPIEARNNTTEEAGYTRSRKRRPKKLHRAPDQDSSNPKNAPNVPTSIIPQPVVSIEIEALKDRVKGIETQLHELLQRTPPKLPRRRQRQRKSGQPDIQDESQEELQRLEGELKSARKELEHLRTRSVVRSATRSDAASTSIEEEGDNDVEEIPRTSEPVLRQTRRAVTMSGSYSLPIPFTASERELRSIQEGISSAQRLAQQFLDANPLYNSISAERAFASRTTVTRTGSSWSEWYGGYIMSLSLPDPSSTEPNLASSFASTSLQRPYHQSLPSTSPRTINSPPTRPAPPKLEIRSGKAPRSVDRKASRLAHSVTQSSTASLLA